MKRCKCFIVLGLPYLLLLLIVSSYLPHATSLSFNYNFSDPAVLAGADLKYMNDSAPVLDRIDLTNQSRRWSTGRVAHGQAVRLWDDSTGEIASFTSNFVFAIKPANSTYPEASSYCRTLLMACAAFYISYSPHEPDLSKFAYILTYFSAYILGN
jgi:hypothetical protein